MKYLSLLTLAIISLLACDDFNFSKGEVTFDLLIP